ncbi:hypothetical protein EB796_016285 [Bugula neritina]|uniref:Uncharacterized protein n=1 Tax=Bugula neritina TaxID=10212 RepID=A0A7J7JIE5_BUGNE|nr:hypothetical protein EB796_016285 [Bugula neritina]
MLPVFFSTNKSSNILPVHLPVLFFPSAFKKNSGWFDFDYSAQQGTWRVFSGYLEGTLRAPAVLACLCYANILFTICCSITFTFFIQTHQTNSKCKQNYIV